MLSYERKETLLAEMEWKRELLYRSLYDSPPPIAAQDIQKQLFILSRMIQQAKIELGIPEQIGE